MLTKFSVTNFKNFNETFTFDLTDTRDYQFNTECVKDGVVNKAIIYGANGCGKSNLGFAIFDLINHLTDKDSRLDLYQYYKNATNDDKKLTEFYYEFTFGQNMVQYSYGKSDKETLVYESLVINKQKYASIDRRDKITSSTASITAKGAETLKAEMGESTICLLSYLKNNALLDKDDKNNQCFFQFLEFVNGMLFFRSLNGNNFIGFEKDSDQIGVDIIKRGHVNDFETFLKEAGIKCRLGTMQMVYGEDLAFDFNDRFIPFFEIASQGTQTLALFYYWFQRFNEENSKVQFVFIDEFDAFYHHSLSRLIVKKLKKVGAQVIITTHNPSIMTNDLMRPDCYFVMNAKNIQPLHKTTDKELREAHSIEKMFRAGKFNG